MIETGGEKSGKSVLAAQHNDIYIYIYIYIYIVIHSQTVSLYHNSSRSTLEAEIETHLSLRETWHLTAQPFRRHTSIWMLFKKFWASPRKKKITKHFFPFSYHSLFPNLSIYLSSCLLFFVYLFLSLSLSLSFSLSLFISLSLSHNLFISFFQFINLFVSIPYFLPFSFPKSIYLSILFPILCLPCRLGGGGL